MKIYTIIEQNTNIDWINWAIENCGALSIIKYDNIVGCALFWGDLKAVIENGGYGYPYEDISAFFETYRLIDLNASTAIFFRFVP